MDYFVFSEGMDTYDDVVKTILNLYYDSANPVCRHGIITAMKTTVF